MDLPRRDEGPGQAPSHHLTEDTQPGSSTANLTEEDIMGAGGGSGWRLDEVMDARYGKTVIAPSHTAAQAHQCLIQEVLNVGCAGRQRQLLQHHCMKMPTGAG